ncbi:MAG TPA: hypothetical protein VI566_13625 [Xanthomonadales bacterium]|nr:hypothetical protein [Xanthomonadales bacterium]
MKWLDDNPVGTALGIFCGLLLLLLALLLVLSSLPLPSAPEAGDTAGADAALELPQLAGNKPIDTYNVITQRPLFNETRQPALDGDGSNLDEALAEDMVGAPEVELSGVIITPTLRMVTLKRRDDGGSLVAFEGKPIEADFGSWQISSVQARAATMISGSGEELHLEMKVHDMEIAQPDLPAPRREQLKPESNAATQQAPDTEPLSRAEEIRQRIAERREELRREAEQAEAGGQEQQEPSYKEAIQSMIGRNRGDQTNKENEQ